MQRILKLNQRKGQSLVETALILPIMILILMGIIDFGLMFNNYMIISNASREGARGAAVGMTDALITSMVSDITSTLDQTKLVTKIDPYETPREKGTEVTVTVEYDYKLLTPIISAIIPNPMHIKGMTVMRIE